MPAHAARQYRDTGIADASLRLPGLGRFRVNLHRERGRAAAAIRVLPARVPTLADLNLPPEVEQLSRLGRGLVLVGGATGSGKTTTMAALVDAINRREAKHIITVEDPIEYEHTHQAGLIEQVEVGVDAPDFPTALRAAVRQAPDILVIGEMRDHESMRIALSAAETGHLVFSSLHTTDIASTIGRICDSFPNERQNTIRQELSLALSAVTDSNADPPPGRRPRPRRGAADGELRRAPAHPEGLAAAPASGNHDDAEGGIAHARRVAGAAGQDRRDLEPEALARAGHPEELDGLLR